MTQRYTTTRDIVIPAGTEVALGPVMSRYLTPHAEILVEFHKDSVGALRLDLQEGLDNGLLVPAKDSIDPK